MHLALQLGQCLVGPRAWRVRIKPARGESFRQDPLKCGTRRCQISELGFANGGCDVAIRREVYADRFALAPIGGDLQDRRSAEPSVSDQHLLSERLMIGS